jgi:hypothetical protein
MQTLRSLIIHFYAKKKSAKICLKKRIQIFADFLRALSEPPNFRQSFHCLPKVYVIQFFKFSWCRSLLNMNFLIRQNICYADFMFFICRCTRMQTVTRWFNAEPQLALANFMQTRTRRPLESEPPTWKDYLMHWQPEFFRVKFKLCAGSLGLGAWDSESMIRQWLGDRRSMRFMKPWKIYASWYHHPGSFIMIH